VEAVGVTTLLLLLCYCKHGYGAEEKKGDGGTGCYVTMEVVWRTKNDPIMLLLLLLASMIMAQREKTN
jgi:hypothetical protein